MPVEIGRDDANICLYPSPHWTNQSAPASPHMAYPSATTFLAACHCAHSSLRSSLLCLGNRSGRGGKVALLNMAQIQPHEHQTPSPWTCWLCSCQPTLKPAHPGFSFTHQTTHYTMVVLLLSFCLLFPRGVTNSLGIWTASFPHHPFVSPSLALSRVFQRNNTHLPDKILLSLYALPQTSATVNTELSATPTTYGNEKLTPQRYTFELCKFTLTTASAACTLRVGISAQQQPNSSAWRAVESSASEPHPAGLASRG